jgi:hypothetical protein
MFILAPLLAATAHAAVPTYDVTFTAAAGAREVSGAHLTIRPGRPARLVQSDALGSLEVELNARPDGDHIFVTADLTRVDQRGTRHALGRPQILALANEPAAMEVGDHDPRGGRDIVRYAIRVLAKIKN